MPNKTVSKFTTGAAAAVLASAMVLGVGAPAAQAQNFGGVLGCQASGGKQEGGGLLGALLGAAAGATLAK